MYVWSSMYEFYAISVCIRARMHAHMHTHASVLHMYARDAFTFHFNELTIHVSQIHMHVYTHICIHTYVHVCMNIRYYVTTHPSSKR